LDSLGVVARQEQTVVLSAEAKDALSGTADFYVKVTNSDNYSEEIIKPGADGKIRLEITKDDPAFTGDFTVTAVADDRVGNETVQKYEVTEFSLETEVERILKPHEPVFKCGESGILKVKVYGYAERVEVEFPEEMTSLCPELNRTFTYEAPLYSQEEEIQFMIPLYTPENAGYRITVRAYKGEKKLEEHPAVSVIEVGDSVLGEFRTRLR
jgi:hypothetical protein